MVGEVSSSSGTAPYNKDFIELYNPTDQPVDLTGWSVQYGIFNGNVLGHQSPLSGVHSGPWVLFNYRRQAGQRELTFQLPDVSGSYFNGWWSAGKVALFKDKTTAVSGAKPADAVDFVGYGSANAFEGICFNKNNIQYDKCSTSPICKR